MEDAQLGLVDDSNIDPVEEDDHAQTAAAPPEPADEEGDGDEGDVTMRVDETEILERELVDVDETANDIEPKVELETTDAIDSERAPNAELVEGDADVEGDAEMEVMVNGVGEAAQEQGEGEDEDEETEVAEADGMSSRGLCANWSRLPSCSANSILTARRTANTPGNSCHARVGNQIRSIARPTLR